MKVRQGYVSNSSSSSFVVRANSYESVFDLAKTMIPGREWEDDQELIKKIEEAEIRGMDPNTSISFNSCNYETYIVKHKNYYLISTCNNHYWSDYVESLGHIPDDLKDITEDFEDLEGVVPKLSSFWYAEYNIGGTPLSYEDPRRKAHECSEHWYDIIDIKGEKDPVCVVCYAEKRDKKIKEQEIKKFESLSILEKVSYVEDKIIEIDSNLSKEDKKRIFNTLEEVKRLL